MRGAQARIIFFLCGAIMLGLGVSTAYADYNWPYGPPPDARPPQVPKPVPGTPKVPCDTEVPGSIISCQSQTLGETVSITGTPVQLHYGSDRMPGRKDAYTLDIPLSGATLPASLRRIELQVSVAGKKFTQNFGPTPNQHYKFTWDGKDAYGRTVQGGAIATVRIGYVYGAVYGAPPLGAQSFGAVSGSAMAVAIPARLEFTFWQEAQSRLGTLRAPVGGWSLSPQHVYDPTAQVLYQGDGTRRDAQALGRTITTVAGDGNFGFGCGVNGCGDGGPATKAGLTVAYTIALGPDGSLYIPDRDNSRVRRVGPDGIITTVVGRGGCGFSGDGGPATQAQVCSPLGVAIGPDGSLYIADSGNQRVRRVALDGTITTVAGNGDTGGGGGIPRRDGPATQVVVYEPTWIAVGPDDSLYIADGSIVRRVGADGLITTFAGSTGGRCARGAVPSCGDTGPARLATFYQVTGIAVAPDGAIYIADQNDPSVRRVGSDGIITTVAGGTGIRGFSGDGGPATQAQLNGVSGVSLGPNGSLFITDQNNSRIRLVVDGIITTVAGTGAGRFSGDGGLATQAGLTNINDAQVGPDGSLYIWGSNSRRVRKVAPFLPGVTVDDFVVAAEDGSEVYVFTNSGRHLRTMNALTGSVRYQFGYDSVGQLISITDGDGNVTAITRDASGNPTALMAPRGQRTTLTVDTNGYLATVTNPANERVQLSYTAEGLLLTEIDPKGGLHRYGYDALGRLIRDEDPAGGVQTLARVDTSTGHTVTRTTALGRTSTYQVEHLPSGAIRRSVTHPSGAKTVALIGTDGSKQTAMPDGSATTVQYGPDPRFGMQARVATSVILKTPAGRTRTITTTRTATLSDPNNLFSLTKLTDTVTDNGVVSTREYDGTSRVWTSTTAVGRSGTLKVDALGRMTQVQTAGLAPVDFAYDSHGLLSTVTEGSGATSRITNLTYNSARNLSGVGDALGQTMGFAYDTAERLNTHTLPDSRVLRYTYDAAGNTKSIIPPGRPAHGFAYTPIDQMASYTPPNVGLGSTVTQYTYNADRALTRVTRPDGQVLDLTYDAAGRTSTLNFARGLLNYTYSATTAKLTGVTAPGGVGLGYSYDGARLSGATWTGPVSGTTAYTYNNDFRVTTETVNGANNVSFTYDADGLLTTAGSMSLTHNAQNSLLTGTTLGSVTDIVSYTDLAELKEYSVAYSGSGMYSASYLQDAIGRITQKTETVAGATATYGYTYDAAGRLSGVTKNGNAALTYTYDSNGNRIGGTRSGGTVSATYDNQDRLLTYGSATYSHTANGERLSKTAGGQITTYQYDALGNLTTATLPSGTVIDYLIDGRNRRIGKKVNGTVVQAFLYQGSLRPIAELDGSNTIVRRFVYATHINVPDYMIKGGVTYRIITDHLGSPRLVIDVATGTLAQRMDYDEFGNVTADTNPGFQPFGFAGGLYDRDTMFVRFGARDYDALSGRWTTKDPIGFGGGDANHYAYGSNDPVNFIDPNGNESESCAPKEGLWEALKKLVKSSRYRGRKVIPLPPVIREVSKAAGEEGSEAQRGTAHAFRGWKTTQIMGDTGDTEEITRIRAMSLEDFLKEFATDWDKWCCS